ncbi:MAG: hypothetical protein FWB86_01865 [Treponema sp.]|nr:hypothetical protein [Treponema sp.]MCL2250906.1 hypothetical protein [Treponema sp.]
MTEAPEKKKIYHKRLRSGLCPRCGGKVRKSSPYKTCDTCREFYRNYQNENTDTINETRRERYEQRKKKGLCPKCGVPVGKKAKNFICSKCLKKQYKIDGKIKKTKKRK